MKKEFTKLGSLILGFIFLIGYSTDVISQDNSGNKSSIIDNFDNIPQINWTFKTNSSIFASPVVCDNIVYVGSTDSILYALYIKSGTKAWSFKTNGGIRSNVCINGEYLYLNGGDGIIYKLNKRTGAQVWQFKTKGERNYDFADYFHSTPILFNNNLFFGSGDGYLYAINAETGALIWQFQTDNIVHTTPAIDNNRIFFGSFDGYVYGLNLVNGELIWKFKTVGHRYFPQGEVQGSPVAFNNIVFIGARDYNVYAIDQEKGYCHWNKAFTEGWGLNNNINDSILYIGSADERVLIATNPTNGKELWKKKMEFLVFGNNAYSKSMMYIGTTIGKLHGINLTTGEKLWSFETESYQDNRLKYFKNDDSYRDDIYSIIKSNEHFLEVECELGGIFSTPFITDDNILFTSTNGKIYCLKK